MMQEYVAYVQNNTLRMLKIGRNAIAKAASDVIQRIPLVVVLPLAKVGHTKLAQRVVKHLYANIAVKISFQIII